MENNLEGRKPKKHEAWMPVTKKQAKTLLKALTSLKEKQDPTVVGLKKELENIRDYWYKLETLSFKKTESKKNKYLNEAKDLVSKKQPKTLGGKAGKKLLKKKGIK